MQPSSLMLKALRPGQPMVQHLHWQLAIPFITDPLDTVRIHDCMREYAREKAERIYAENLGLFLMKAAEDVL